MPIDIRPEAQSLYWDSLNRAQQDAFRRILTILVAGLPKGSRPKPTGVGVRRGVDEWLSPNRANRTSFIHGKRGSGKTTVLLSLMKACASNVSSAELESFPAPVRTQIDQLRDRLVWLEPIDMEPAPEGLHILGAILARIEKAVAYLGVDRSGGNDSEMRSGILDPQPGHYSALMDLRRLQTNVGIAWDGDVSRRGAGLDPDTYSQEVMRAERARLSLNREFEKVLDGLADTLFRGSEVGNPLFVLPIDDFDLNPPTCLPLLRMLRTIAVPRLFTLILGDYDIAQLVLNLKLANDLSALAPDISDPDMLVGRSRIAQTAAGISEHALRKLLPPTQRITLPHFDRTEGYGFRPNGSVDQDPKLYRILASVPVAAPGGEWTFMGTRTEVGNYALRTVLDYLVAPGLYLMEEASPLLLPPPKDDLDPTVLENARYSGVDIVATSPRRLVDLWLRLEHMHDPRRGETDGLSETAGVETLKEFALEMTSDLWDLLEAEPRVREADGRLGLTKVADTEPDPSELPLELYGRTQRVHEVEGSLPRLPTQEGDYAVYCDLNSARGWDLRIRQSPDESGRIGPTSLSGDALSTYVLSRDLMAIFGSRAQRSLVTVESAISEDTSWAETRWSLGEAHSVGIQWPIPRFGSVWALDQFLAAWNEFLNTTSAHTSTEKAAFTWITLGTAVLREERPAPAREQLNVSDWKRLAHSLGSEEPVAGFRDWLVDVVAFLMPEFGLQGNVRQAVFGESAVGQFSGRYRGLIRRARVHHLTRLWDAGFDTLVEALRREPQEFPIGSRFFPPLDESGFGQYQEEDEDGPGSPRSRPRSKAPKKKISKKK